LSIIKTMMFFALLVLAVAFPQTEMVDLAKCWRDLKHEHGQRIDVHFECTEEGSCVLAIASCALQTIQRTGDLQQVFRTNDEDMEFTLEILLDQEKFRLKIMDHLDHGFLANGTIGVTTTSQKRILTGVNIAGELNALGVPLDPKWTGFASTYLFGIRRDCEKEGCPDRWTDCWEGAKDSMIQVQVFVIMHQTFVDSFGSDAHAEEYLYGVFRDMNLLYESQLGISLRPAFFLPPAVLKKYWPAVAEADKFILGKLTLKRVEQELACSEEKFKRYIGRNTSDFGIFHVVFGKSVHQEDPNALTKSGNTIGLATVGTVCTCRAIGWTRYSGDRPGAETWATMAHEIAHNLGGTHYFKLAKTESGEDPDGGVLDYGTGLVAGKVAFNILNKPEMCLKVREMIDKEDTGAGCFLPYFGHLEKDPRFGQQYIIVYAVFAALLVLSCLFLLACFFNYFRVIRWRKRYKRLRRVHAMDVGRMKNYIADKVDDIQDLQHLTSLKEKEIGQADRMIKSNRVDQAFYENRVNTMTQRVQELEKMLAEEQERRRMEQSRALDLKSVKAWESPRKVGPQRSKAVAVKRQSAHRPMPTVGSDQDTPHSKSSSGSANGAAPSPVSSTSPEPKTTPKKVIRQGFERRKSRGTPLE